MPRYIVQVDPSRLVVLQQALPSVPLVKLVGKPVFGAVVIEAPESALPAIRALEGVKRVELDKKVSAAVVATVEAELNEIQVKGPLAFLTLSLPRRSMVPTSLSRKVMGADVAESLGITGEGVKVAVIDTGGDPTHPQILGVKLHSAMATQPVGFDENGHSTHVSTTIAGKSYWHPYGALLGVAPKADLIIIKALGYVIGSGSWSEILRAMDMAVTLGADVISMSLGGSDDTTDREDTGFMAIEQMGQSGIAVVIAAGNSGPKPGAIGYPGAAPAALTVGAIDENLRLADFSSRGPTRLGLVKPDVVAPGVNILSGTTGIIAAYRAIDGFRVGAISGTSMATPHASGLVALARQYAKQKGVPRSNPGAITAEHVKQAMEKVSGAKSNDHGYGLVTFPILKAYIDALAATESNLAATGLATG